MPSERGKKVSLTPRTNGLADVSASIMTWEDTALIWGSVMNLYSMKIKYPARIGMKLGLLLFTLVI